MMHGHDLIRSCTSVHSGSRDVPRVQGGLVVAQSLHVPSRGRLTSYPLFHLSRLFSPRLFAVDVSEFTLHSGATLQYPCVSSGQDSHLPCPTHNLRRLGRPRTRHPSSSLPVSQELTNTDSVDPLPSRRGSDLKIELLGTLPYTLWRPN